MKTRIGAWIGLLAALLLVTCVWSTYLIEPWSEIWVFHNNEVAKWEFHHSACLASSSIEGDDIWIAFEEVDDTTDEWLYYLSYYKWDAADPQPSFPEGGERLLGPTNSGHCPSLTTDGSRIWMAYRDYGPGGSSIFYRTWDSNANPKDATDSLVEFDSDLIGTYNPYITFVPTGTDLGEIWLVFDGAIELRKKSKGKGRSERKYDVYLVKGEIQLGGHVDWGPIDQLTYGDGRNFDPAIAITGMGTFLAWRSYDTGEYQLWAGQLAWDETEGYHVVNDKTVTNFNGWYPTFQLQRHDDGDSTLWLYFQGRLMRAACKELLDPSTNEWANLIWISDVREDVREPKPIRVSPLLPADDVRLGWQSCLILGDRIAASSTYRLGYTTKFDDPEDPEAEVNIEKVEYNVRSATLTVEAFCTEAVPYLTVSGSNGPGEWTAILGARCEDLDGDGIYEFRGRTDRYEYVMVETPGYSIPNLKPPAFDTRHVGTKGKGNREPRSKTSEIPEGLLRK